MTSTTKIPYKISQYIKDHFREDFLFSVKTITTKKGEKQYHVEVTKDNAIHHLKFNADGGISTEETEAAFPSEDDLI